MNEHRNYNSILQFLTIDLNNNNVAICKTCYYKLSLGNNLKIWECLLVTVRFRTHISSDIRQNPVLARFLKMPSGASLACTKLEQCFCGIS